MCWDLPARLNKINIVRLEECDSTHKYMREMHQRAVETGHALSPFTIVVANHQTAGHGRRNRPWIAPKGKNLCFNILLPTKNLKPEHYAPTTQIAAITIARILREKGINANVKWPNDILVNKHKICGIISELFLEPHPSISLGIGLNANTEKSDFVGLDRLATSMFIETGKIWDKDALLHEFLEKFMDNFELLQKSGLLPFIEEWRRMDCFAGCRARVADGGSVLEGTIEEVQNDGTLLFRTEEGLKTVWSGDLEI